MTEKLSGLLKEIQHLINLLDEINELLLNDKTLLADSNMDAIKESDEKKHECLREIVKSLNRIKSELPHSRDTNLFEAISTYAAGLSDLDGKIKLTAALDAVKSKLTTGYERLTTNNHIIMGNLGDINKIWAQLVELTKTTPIYEKPT